MGSTPMTASRTLPDPLPIFPLTGTLLLPANWLPLNIFERRYLAMVEDAMAEGKTIGMIQPLTARQDNAPPYEVLLEEIEDHPSLYRVGCAGRIEKCEQQPDGRFLILLRGVSRFRVATELPLHRGYRRVVPDYRGFARDEAEGSVQLDPRRLLAAVRAFAGRQGLEFDDEVLNALPGISLLNGLSVALPFRSDEKQALLEAETPAEREEMLLTLLGMGVDLVDLEDHYVPPILN